MIVRLASLSICFSTLAAAVPARAATVVDFEGLLISPATYFNGDSGNLSPGQSDPTPWMSGGVSFSNTFGIDNTYDPFIYEYWYGFAYSNVTDSTTSGFGNQYAAYPGGGFESDAYAVAFGDTSTITLPSGYAPGSVQVTTTTYAALDMANGSQFSEKFGWRYIGDERVNVAAPDWFLVRFTGYSGLDGTGSQTGAVDFYLADFRFADDADDYIVNQWQSVDLSPLINAMSIKLSWDSSDSGAFGMNTPAYVAIDSLTLVPVPEPGTWALGASAVVVALALRRRSPRLS